MAYGLVFVQVAFCANEGQTISLHSSLSKMPINFQAAFSVRTINPSAVDAIDRESMVDYDYVILKSGSSYSLSATTADQSPPRETVRICYDGNTFYYFMPQNGTLRTGTKLSDFDSVINGVLKYSPPFLLKTNEIFYGPPKVDSSGGYKSFFTPDRFWRIDVSDSGLFSNLKFEGGDYRIPSEITVTSRSGENYSKISPLFSYTVKLTSFEKLESKGAPSNRFKVPVAEARRLIDADLNGLEIVK